MSRVSCVSSGKVPQALLRMAWAERLRYCLKYRGMPVDHIVFLLYNEDVAGIDSTVCSMSYGNEVIKWRRICQSPR